MSRCKLSKEELLQLVKDFSIKNGRSPKLKEIKQVNGFPNRKVYYRVFDTTTWNDVLELAGLEKNRNTKGKYNKEDLKGLLVEYYKKHGKVPLSKHITTKSGLPSAVVFYDRFRTQSWNEILSECGLPMNHYQGYTRESMINILKDIYTKYSKIPTYEEWCEYNILPNHGQYARVFGSIENACVIAGLVKEPLSKEVRVENNINLLKSLADSLKCIPNVVEFEKELSLDLYKFIDRRGMERELNLSYGKICDKYLQEYDYRNRFGGKMCRDNNGETCRSTVERDITNFLIYNNIEYVKEYHYKNITKREDDNRRMDWKLTISGVDYYIEYLGMYSHSKNNIVTPYIEKTKSKIEDLKKFKVWDNSLFIYPKDLKKNKISEIFNCKLNSEYKEYEVEYV
jgi:hypothetical protein